MLLERVRRRLFSPFRAELSQSAGQRPVFFLHIPKTAGTSLLHTLVWRFPPNACLHDPQVPTRRHMDVNQFQFVSGHADFTLVKQFHQQPIIITFLRNPIDRALSSYYFRRSYTPEQVREEFRQHGEDPNSKWVVDRVHRTELLRRLSLRELLHEEPKIAQGVVGNAHTLYLAGRLNGNPSKLIHQALENLERCEVVGLTERFAESVDLLSRKLGWEPFAEIPRYNITGKRLAASELDDETRAALTEFLAPDIALYEAAKKLFEQRLFAAKSNDRSVSDRQQATLLPDAADFTFAGPVIGAGWYPREKCGSTWSSWSGVGVESWLDLRRPADTSQHFFCELFHPVSPQVLRSAQVRINDHLITLRQRESGRRVLLEGDVPAAAIKANRDKIRVSFVVNDRWRPCDLDPTSKDDRWLGINVSRLSLKRAA